jgi:hypothetical protein
MMVNATCYARMPASEWTVSKIDSGTSHWAQIRLQIDDQYLHYPGALGQFMIGYKLGTQEPYHEHENGTVVCWIGRLASALCPPYRRLRLEKQRLLNEVPASLKFAESKKDQLALSESREARVIAERDATQVQLPTLAQCTIFTESNTMGHDDHRPFVTRDRPDPATFESLPQVVGRGDDPVYQSPLGNFHPPLLPPHQCGRRLGVVFASADQLLPPFDPCSAYFGRTEFDLLACGRIGELGFPGSIDIGDSSRRPGLRANPAAYLQTDR